MAASRAWAGVTLRRTFLAGSIVWAALLPIAPFATVQPSPAPVWYSVAFVLYGAGRFICHQRPERSFFLWAVQMPVCARCTGIYLGGAVAAIVTAMRTVRLQGSVSRPGKPGPMYVVAGALRSPRVLLVATALPTAATLVFEWATGLTPSNLVRAMAGAPLGAAVVLVITDALSLPQKSR